MKNKLNKNKLFGKAGLLYIATLLLSLVSFHSYSQTILPPAGTTPPGQPTRTPPETQPPVQTYPQVNYPQTNYPAQKQMGKDTLSHLKKDTSHVKSPPPKLKPTIASSAKPTHGAIKKIAGNDEALGKDE